MTEKEAIYILRNAAWLGSDADRQKVEEAVEVVARAIEALNNSEIPNGSDCIDRAEAQTAIQFAARRYTVAHEAHGEGHVVWSDNLISVTDAMNALREVPSAQPEKTQLSGESTTKDSTFDCISRQYAIDALKQQADTMSGWSERYAEQRKGVLTAVNIVEDLQYAQTEQTKMIKEIRKWINSGNRGSADYFIVDKIEEIINKYE